MFEEIEFINKMLALEQQGYQIIWNVEFEIVDDKNEMEMLDG